MIEGIKTKLTYQELYSVDDYKAFYEMFKHLPLIIRHEIFVEVKLKNSKGVSICVRGVYDSFFTKVDIYYLYEQFRKKIIELLRTDPSYVEVEKCMNSYKVLDLYSVLLGSNVN